MSSRQYPHSLQAERALLGGILVEPSSIDSVLGKLAPSDFYRPDHGQLFRLLLDMHNAGSVIDLTTLPRQLHAGDNPEQYGGVSYVLELSQYSTGTANLDHYASQIGELAVLRRLITMAEGLKQRASTSGDDAGILIEEGIKELANLGADRPSDSWAEISVVIDDEVTRIEALERVDGTMVGTTTGFTDLDEKLTGLRAGQLIILAARPGMGKTALALNMAQNAALKRDDGQAVAIFSLEMTRNELVNRMLVSLALVDAGHVRTGNLTPEEWTAITDASYELRGTKVFIDDTPALTIGDLRARARKLAADHGGLKLVVVDYLQLMRGDDARAPRIQQVGEISRGLKALAKDLEVPVIALSQLNRGVESRQDKRPLLSDLRESGAIEQDADVILFIYRDEYYNKESSAEPGLAEVIIAKQRAGSTGSIKLAFEGRFTRFDNLMSTGPLID